MKQSVNWQAYIFQIEKSVNYTGTYTVHRWKVDANNQGCQIEWYLIRFDFDKEGTRYHSIRFNFDLIKGFSEQYILCRGKMTLDSIASSESFLFRACSLTRLNVELVAHTKCFGRFLCALIIANRIENRILLLIRYTFDSIRTKKIDSIRKFDSISIQSDSPANNMHGAIFWQSR
jgi:hypothetical protein